MIWLVEPLWEILIRKILELGITYWLMQLVMSGQTAININREVGPYFRNRWGVC
jgi:hypothetical protein